jgi:hypothetical protein
MIAISFIAGTFIAGIAGAGKNQGLAGGAIVLGYGVAAAFIGLILAYFLTKSLSYANLIKADIILGIGLVAMLLFLNHRYKEKQKDKQTIEHTNQIPTKPSPVLENEVKIESDYSIGLGFFKPNFIKNNKINIYGNPSPNNTPIDSIIFKTNEHGNRDIAYAPEWLKPHHLKLDYDILYFKILSISNKYIEVIGNTMDEKAIFISIEDGEVIRWNDFLLNVNSVEFINKNTNRIYENNTMSGKRIKTVYSFLKPISIQDDLMEVELIDDNYKAKGKGWIRWKDENQLLISYSLLS